MNCVVTAGPSYEPLDRVRRLTNFSSGRLGTELANFLKDRGHGVTLLLGEQATWSGPRRARRVRRFTTTSDLAKKLKACAPLPGGVVLHAAAVSDFTFGSVWARTAAGALRRVRAGKLSTRQGALLAELRPTPKLLSRLRHWFPQALLVGWKFEVSGGRARLLANARRQIEENNTDACVANGPAYGRGFGLVARDGQVRHCRDRRTLFAALDRMLSPAGPARGQR